MTTPQASDVVQTRGVFQPGLGAVAIRFVHGNEGLSPIPEIVARSGLRSRFAIVQDSYVKGCVDTYFDEPLWKALLRYMARHSGQVTVLDQYRDTDEVPLSNFIDVWDRADREDREPAWAVIVRSGDQIALAMVTEYWAHVGGPAIYHDSYTYSLFSQGDVGDDVILALRDDPDASQWSLAADVIEVPAGQSKTSPIAPRRRRSLVAWLLRRT